MKWPGLVLVLLVLGVGGYLLIPKNQPVEVPSVVIPTLLPESSFAPYTARFEIVTSGTKRIFTDARYHNQSTDVYITATDPSQIMVNKPDVTWQQFFDTLPAPMKVGASCLHTGTGQEFCTNETQTLRFILNGQDQPDVLTIPIAPNDNLLISFD